MSYVSLQTNNNGRMMLQYNYWSGTHVRETSLYENISTSHEIHTTGFLLAFQCALLISQGHGVVSGGSDPVPDPGPVPSVPRVPEAVPQEPELCGEHCSGGPQETASCPACRPGEHSPAASAACGAAPVPASAEVHMGHCMYIHAHTVNKCMVVL